MQPVNGSYAIDEPVSLVEIALSRYRGHLAAIKAPRRTIDEVMAEARLRLHRVSPRVAEAEMRAGAVVVDTRSQAQRERTGEVPGALKIERNVLEWRLDPASPHKIPEVTGYGLRVIVMCAEGYSSVLAALSLQELGMVNATDMIGGFEAWANAGLPVIGGLRDSA